MRRFIVTMLMALGGSDLAQGQPITLAETTFAMGRYAWPSQVQCLSGDSACGHSDVVFSEPPILTFISQARTLLFDNRLDGAYSDLTDDDNLRLDYPVPIVNQPGADVYLGQALWSGSSDLGFADPIEINDFGLSFDNGTSWHTVAGAEFSASSLPFQSVYFSDGGALESTYF